MGFYLGDTVLRVRAQYRRAADGRGGAAAHDWQHACLAAAELAEHGGSTAEHLTVSATQQEPDRLTAILRAALAHGTGGTIEIKQMEVEVVYASTHDHPTTPCPHWLPVPDACDRFAQHVRCHLSRACCSWAVPPKPLLSCQSSQLTNCLEYRAFHLWSLVTCRTTRWHPCSCCWCLLMAFLLPWNPSMPRSKRVALMRTRRP